MRLAVTSLALLATAPTASAAESYQWSGTLTVTRESGTVDTSFAATMTGPVSTSPSGITWYQPTMLAYHDAHHPPDAWCHSTSDLVLPDVADQVVPLFVDWGRPRTDGLAPVPRILPGTLEWSFPRHSFQCLAYGGGEIMRYEDFLDGTYGLDHALACSDPDPGLSREGIPIALGVWSPPPLPAAQLLPDGSIRFAGTVRLTCPLESTSGLSTVTMTVDLTGTPTPDPSVAVPPRSHEVSLDVVVHGTQYGSVVDGSGAISCGQGGVACSTSVPAGTTVRLAALQSEAGAFHVWLGCDQVIGYGCLVTLGTSRVVHAWFGYDFAGQWEPPPDGLFDPARKAEIASNGAESARTGAIGCGLTAGLIGTAGSSSVIVAGTAGAATRWNALVQQAFEETIGNCATGLAGTIFNGLLLKIDPPDPEWPQIALAERYPRARGAPCRPRGAACTAVDRARRDLADANARVLELQEALAVAANRYGNAVTAKDLPTQALHQATMRATSLLLADATAGRTFRARALVARIRALGVRSAIVPRAAAAAALRARATGRGIDRATVARLLRKRLIATAGEVQQALRADTPQKPASIDLLRALERPVSTARMRAAGRELTLGDVARLLQAVLRDTRVPQDVADRTSEQLARALQCDAGSPAALRALASLATARPGLPGEAGLLVRTAALEVATHDLRRDEACAG